MEARKLNIEPTNFLVDDLFVQTIETFNAWAKSKQVALESRLSKDKIALTGDLDRITQVLTNLTGNALKFTPAGGRITLEATTKETDSDSGAPVVRISVRDTGPGIAKKDHSKIFDKFVSLNTSQLQGISSTGLGLSISKEIVELHGGRIWVEFYGLLIGFDRFFILFLAGKYKALLILGFIAIGI